MDRLSIDRVVKIEQYTRCSEKTGAKLYRVLFIWQSPILNDINPSPTLTFLTTYSLDRWDQLPAFDSWLWGFYQTNKDYFIPEKKYHIYRNRILADAGPEEESLVKLEV